MKSLLPAAWVAEAMKLRGTLALALAVFAPVLVVALFCAQMLLAPSPSVPPASGEQAWLALIRGMLALWCFLMLPLYVTLQAALLANMDMPTSSGSTCWRSRFPVTSTSSRKGGRWACCPVYRRRRCTSGSCSRATSCRGSSLRWGSAGRLRGRCYSAASWPPRLRPR